MTLNKNITEEQVWKAHNKRGQRRYGKKWDMANIGWYSGDLVISSKVYGKPTVIFTTNVIHNKITHTESPYGEL